MQTLQINGMHCAACKKLIMMELEEAGLVSLVQSISEPEHNQGKIVLSEDITAEQIEKVKEVINSMDDYSVN